MVLVRTPLGDLSHLPKGWLWTLGIWWKRTKCFTPGGWWCYLQQPPFRVQSKAWVYNLLVKVLCNPFPARHKFHQDFFAGTLSWSPLQQRRGVTMGWDYNGKYIRLWMLAGSLWMHCCTGWLIQAQWQWACLRYWLPCTFWTEDTYCNIIEELQYHEIRGRMDGSRTVSSRDCRGCSVLFLFCPTCLSTQWFSSCFPLLWLTSTTSIALPVVHNKLNRKALL